MRIFIMHIGHPGNIDIKYTITRRRSTKEILDEIGEDAPERAFFENDEDFKSYFPDGHFNCWGIPQRARPAFDKTRAGDLVLFVPTIGVHGGISHIGIVRAKCRITAHRASRALWPDTPHDRVYPWLFFFNTENGHLEWFEFLQELGYNHDWNPNGWYRELKAERFGKFGGADGYLQHLRSLGFG